MPPPDPIDVSDLMGLRHEPGQYAPASGALDCAGVVAEVLRRAGMSEARTAFLRAVTTGTPGHWSPVADDVPSIGDIAVEFIGGEMHVGAVVSTSPLAVLTSYRSTGVRMCPHRALKGATIYRYAPKA